MVCNTRVKYYCNAFALSTIRRLKGERAGVSLRPMKHSHRHGHDHGAQYKEAMDRLRKAGLRITEPRQALLRVLIEEHGPFTMDELFKRLKKGTCDLVTMYRSLPALEDAGVVRRCDFGDGNVRYEFNETGPCQHHHIICRKCRKVETLEVCIIDALDRLVKEKGYSHVSHSLEFFGVCPACEKKRPS
jgi:Fur family transcriptional regulator, ferric uptake regulator